jgi:hypothetical protein
MVVDGSRDATEWYVRSMATKTRRDWYCAANRSVHAVCDGGIRAVTDRVRVGHRCPAPTRLLTGTSQR